MVNSLQLEKMLRPDVFGVGDSVLKEERQDLGCCSFGHVRATVEVASAAYGTSNGNHHMKTQSVEKSEDTVSESHLLVRGHIELKLTAYRRHVEERPRSAIVLR